MNRKREFFVSKSGSPHRGLVGALREDIIQCLDKDVNGHAGCDTITADRILRARDKLRILFDEMDEEEARANSEHT